MNKYTIELASQNDLKQILDIYNQAIIAKDNAIIEPIKYNTFVEDFSKRNLNQYPIFTYKVEGDVIGWISLSPYRSNRVAYRKLKEVSFYIDYDNLGKGIGSSMLKYILNNRNILSYDSLIAILVSDNEKSIKLLNKFEFEEWGFFPEVLDMQNKNSSVLIYGLNLRKGK
jgi:L-amino acid N-acyltransferase YncA